MTKEEKDLLLKDLCARLQHNVQILADMDKTFEGGVIGTLKVINLEKDWVELQSVFTPFKFDEIRPYLRSISSMTEEEFVYFMGLRGRMLKSYEIQNMMKKILNMPQFIEIVTTLGSYSNKIDWLNKNHFDYRGLIKKGLALEAPEGMYKTE